MAFKRLVISVCSFVVIFLLGCSPEPKEPSPVVPPPESSEASEDTVKILLMTKSQSNPYYVMMEQGARKAADELGVTLIAKGTPNETYVALQKKMLLGAVDEEFDAIVFVPSKTAQLLPILKQVQEQGMVLVNLDDQINSEQGQKVGLEPIPFVGIDNQAAAQELAERVLNNNPDIASAYIILGPQSSSVSHARANGFRAALQKHQRQLLGEETANWQYVEAYELSERLLREYPDIDAFFCANDVMALAITQQLQDKGRTDVKVIGYDAIPEAKSLVQQGKMEATLDQQSYQQGEIGVQTAVKLLNGESVEAESWVSPELILYRD
ncbi:sugar ABC transporter substrate-binding protein [Vibrio sp. T187]|uniref:substrate-binding domain-containing protein n=1 Tax=Vibrio TaxID=662 RepID=UPI0010C9CCB4|nr:MULTISPECIES: substrate-binding domain-containing protein [Vibrio]MBW3694568.1 sugar ABC transporter substrate-binding protein [Vibrio sp. T187]